MRLAAGRIISAWWATPTEKKLYDEFVEIVT